MKKKEVTETEELSATEEHGEEPNSGDDWTPEVSKNICKYCKFFPKSVNSYLSDK